MSTIEYENLQWFKLYLGSPQGRVGRDSGLSCAKTGANSVPRSRPDAVPRAAGDQKKYLLQCFQVGTEAILGEPVIFHSLVVDKVIAGDYFPFFSVNLI